MMMATAAGIGLFVDTACFQAGLGRHELESMTQGRTGFGAHFNSGHMTTDTVGKGMDRMSVFIGVTGMATQTLPGPGPDSLELRRRQTQLMNIVARGARYAFLSMNGLLPVIVLLMMAVVEGDIGVIRLRVPIHRAGKLLIGTQGPAGPETYRPIGVFVFDRFTTAVAGAADLGSDTGRQFGWIDDGLPFVKDSGLGQNNVAGGRAVARFAADPRFKESTLFQIGAGCVTTAAFF